MSNLRVTAATTAVTIVAARVSSAAAAGAVAAAAVRRHVVLRLTRVLRMGSKMLETRKLLFRDRVPKMENALLGWLNRTRLWRVKMNKEPRK